MRSHVLFTVLGLLALACLIVGCGDDTTTNNPPTGSLSDPEFQAVQEQIDAFVDSTVQFFGDGLSTLRGISSGEGDILPAQYIVDPTETDVFEVAYADGWHTINISKHFDQYATSLFDSVRYIKNSVPQQSPSGADQLLFKHHWDYDVVDTSITHAVIVGNSDFTFANLNVAVAEIDGTNDLSVYSKVVYADSTVRRWFTFDSELTEFEVAYSPFSGWGQCPDAGSISADVQMIYQKDSDAPDTTSWTFTGTFNEGQMTAKCTKDGLNWNYTSQICNVPQ